MGKEKEIYCFLRKCNCPFRVSLDDKIIGACGIRQEDEKIIKIDKFKHANKPCPVATESIPKKYDPKFYSNTIGVLTIDVSFRQGQPHVRYATVQNGHITYHSDSGQQSGLPQMSTETRGRQSHIGSHW